jgi:transposase-like protein
MGTRIPYPEEIKWKAVEMKQSGISTKEIIGTLGIKNKTQVETWVRWYKNGETHQFVQPVASNTIRKRSS